MYKSTSIFVGIGSLIFGYLLLVNYQDSTETAVTATGGAENRSEATITVPRALERNFPATDFSKADPLLEQALSGGPGKDGIPALDNPAFIPLAEFEGSNDIQTIVLEDGDNRKVYPYNILTWHEIVNDTVNDTPVAITFCPLCGSAIVFNRTLPDGQVTTFGVSGSLLESNMIMYDRVSESLWQQSTGKTLAGAYHEGQLTLEPFQLLTLGAVRTLYPNAKILSEDTGFRRDYRRNPYAGYDTDDRFIFEPSNIDRTFNPKEIMVVFLAADETPVATPWNALREAGSASTEVDSVTYTLTVSDTNELTITDNEGKRYPFYYEMWFSVAAQHQNSLVTIDVE